MHYAAVKYERLDGLTDTAPFVLPANHIILGAEGRNHTGSLGIGFEVREGGTILFSASTPANGNWSGVLNAAFNMTGIDRNIDITCSNWPDPAIELDIIVMMVDRSI